MRCHYDADVAICAIDLLLIVRNLPRLTKLSWQRTYFPARAGPRDWATEQEIRDILVGRGGKFCYDVDTIYE